MRTLLKWCATVMVPVLALTLFITPAHAATAAVQPDLLGPGALLLAGATNTLGNYNETFFAQEALIQLEKVLGMAGRCYRGFNADPQIKGSTIQIRRPSSFTAADAPAVASNINTDSVSIVLNRWKEVKFSLTDKDLALSSDRIISDHIRPAAVAIADQVDQDMAQLYNDIPWYSTMSATPALSDITAIKKVMFGNKVPFKDESQLHFMIGGNEQMAFQNAMTVLQNPQAAGLRDGSLGRLYGFDTWANQNTPVHTSGVAADSVGAVTGANAIGTASLVINGVTAGGTFNQGDSFSIAGDAQRYVLTANVTADGGGNATLPIAPALKQATAGSEVVTFFLGGASKTQNLAFHTNAFALATAPLSTMGNQLGAKIAVISDPITNISLRSRLFYIGDTSSVVVALDILYGVKTLDPNLAVRGNAP